MTRRGGRKSRSRYQMDEETVAKRRAMAAAVRSKGAQRLLQLGSSFGHSGSQGREWAVGPRRGPLPRYERDRESMMITTHDQAGKRSGWAPKAGSVCQRGRADCLS